MPHIDLPEGFQGIRSAMAFRPETAKPLNELAEALLHAPNSLPQGDRELIATYVSFLNDCYFCQTVHGSIAADCLNAIDVAVVHTERGCNENGVVDLGIRGALGASSRNRREFSYFVRDPSKK